jgi:hypothetical protein
MKPTQINLTEYFDSLNTVASMGRKRYRQIPGKNGSIEEFEIKNEPEDLNKHGYSEFIQFVKDKTNATIYYSYREALIETQYISITLSFSYNEDKIYYRFDGRESFRVLSPQDMKLVIQGIIFSMENFDEKIQLLKKRYEY